MRDYIFLANAEFLATYEWQHLYPLIVDKWYFWDEAYIPEGPFETRGDAVKGMVGYFAYEINRLESIAHES